MNKKILSVFNVILFLLAITVITFTVMVALGKIGYQYKNESWEKIEVERIDEEDESITEESESAVEEVEKDLSEVEEVQADIIDESTERTEANNGGQIVDADSYAITLITQDRDREFVEKNKIDLSGKKITILGDSLTVGYPEEEIKGDNFPNALKEIFNCEVVNLGITGSTISSVYDNRDPMVDRWRQIDEDSDIIIVYAGTNDMMMIHQDQFGDISTKGTFCGDLESMLSGINGTYPNAKKILINPVVSGYCKTLCDMDPEKYIQQQYFSDIILERAEANGFYVVDLYYTNILNAASRNVLDSFYLVDDLHMNPAGYHVLANHVAVDIIKLLNN